MPRTVVGNSAFPCTLSTSRIAASLVDLRIDQESVPAALKEMEDQPLHTVEKTKPEYVPVDPVAQCTDEQRRAPEEPLPEPSPTLDGGAEYPGFHAVRAVIPRQHLRCFKLSPSNVPAGPRGQVGRDDVEVVVAESDDSPLDDEVLIIEAVLADAAI